MKRDINIIRAEWFIKIFFVVILITAFKLFENWDGSPEQAIISMIVVQVQALIFGIAWGFGWGRSGKLEWF